MTSDDSADDPRPAAAPRGAMPILLGVAVVAAVGVAIAHFVLSMPDPDTAPAPDSNQVSIVMDAVKPPPVPQSNGKMDVLAPGMAEAAAPPPPMVSDEPPVDDAAAAPSATAPAGPSFDCAAHLTRGQAAVCADPGLAALDRRMARAYGQALAAGAPAGDLRADQADWRAAREDAAERSPGAVAQVYDERIRELTDLADYLQRR